MECCKDTGSDIKKNIRTTSMSRNDLIQLKSWKMSLLRLERGSKGYQEYQRLLSQGILIWSDESCMGRDEYLLLHYPQFITISPQCSWTCCYMEIYSSGISYFYLIIDKSFSWPSPPHYDYLSLPWLRNISLKCLLIHEREKAVIWSLYKFTSWGWHLPRRNHRHLTFL